MKILIILGFSVFSLAQAQVMLPSENVTRETNQNLLTGSELFVRTKAPLSIMIPQGELKFEAGFFYVKKYQDHHLVQILTGSGQFLRGKIGDAEMFFPLTQVQIDLDGKVSLKSALDFPLHLLAFHRVFRPNKEQMKKYAELLKGKQKQSLERVSDYYQSYHARFVAAAEERQRLQNERRQKTTQAKSQTRKLFEAKAFGESLSEELYE